MPSRFPLAVLLRSAVICFAAFVGAALLIFVGAIISLEERASDLRRLQSRYFAAASLSAVHDVASGFGDGAIEISRSDARGGVILGHAGGITTMAVLQDDVLVSSDATGAVRVSKTQGARWREEVSGASVWARLRADLWHPYGAGAANWSLKPRR